MLNEAKLVEKLVLETLRSEAVKESSPVKCNEILYGTCTHHHDCVSHKKSAVTNILEAGATRIGNSLGSCDMQPAIAKMIDHTLLKPEATKEQVIQLAEEAKKYCFASVCVNPSWVAICAQILKGTYSKVCTVIGFPLGATSTKAKAWETQIAIEHGATEVDMVINVGYLKSKMYEEVEADIHAVVDVAKRNNVLTKVILETCLLTDEEKVIACILSKNAGANFVKTSTGFSKGGATVEDIALMRKVVGFELGVKASGGVRSKEDAEKMYAAGANRIGASASVEIVQGLTSTSTY